MFFKYVKSKSKSFWKSLKKILFFLFSVMIVLLLRNFSFGKMLLLFSMWNDLKLLFEKLMLLLNLYFLLFFFEKLSKNIFIQKN